MRKTLILIALVILAGCGKQAESDPKAQTMALLEAFHKQDWKALAKVSAFPPSENPGSDVDAWAKGFDAGFQKTGGDVARALFTGMTDLKAGEPTISGDSAKVPTSGTLTIQGQKHPFTGVADMVKDGGVWKWDLKSTGSYLSGLAAELPKLLGK